MTQSNPTQPSRTNGQTLTEDNSINWRQPGETEAGWNDATFMPPLGMHVQVPTSNEKSK